MTQTMREQLQALVDECNQNGVPSLEWMFSRLESILDTPEPAVKVKPWWVPISDPPKTPCFAFVRTIEGEVDVTHYMGDLGWGGYDLDDLTDWHAIEYPEPLDQR